MSQLDGTFEKIIEVDLSILLPKIGKLLEGHKTELKLIEYYRYFHNEKNSPLTLYNRYILSFYYNDDVIRPESDIYFFIKDKIYINKVMNFLDNIYIKLLDYVNPEFVDIVFDRFIVNTDDKLIVQFKVYYPERLKKWLEDK